MVWIYLAESVDSPKPLKAMSGRSPIVNEIATAKLFYFRESRQATFLMLQSGTMSEPYPEHSFLLVSTLSTEGSPAKTFPLQDAELAWAVSAAVYSSRSLGSLAKYDPVSSSWRTSQLSLFEVQSVLLENFAAYGMTVAGEFFPLLMWERITGERDGGSWPTLRAEHDSGRHRGKPDTLHSAVKTWPTPRASEWKGTGPLGSKSQKFMLDKGYLSATVQERGQITGQLNPTWVEWLMGYPCEWTVLKDWATQWYRPRREKRLKD